MNKKVTIIGAGAMGSALTIPVVDNGNEVNLWGTRFDDEVIDSIREVGIHLGIDAKIPSDVNTFYSDQLEKALEGTDIVLIGVISEAVKQVTEKIGSYLSNDMIVMIVSKGIEAENGNLMTMSDVFRDNTPNDLEEISTVIVGGPSIASELANRVATSVVYASNDLGAASICKEIFSNYYYKIEVSDDLIGVSLCAALKNPYAISVNLWNGIKERKGLDRVDNGRAFFFNQSLKEMRRFVETFGGDVESVYGLAGVGDLKVTVRGGRNSIFGTLIGKNFSVDEALEKMEEMGKGTVEGYPTIKSAYSIADDLDNQNKLDIAEDIPLLAETYSILYEEKSVDAGVDDFLSSLE